MHNARGEAAPDRWPALMRQLLDSAAARGESSAAPNEQLDDVVVLAAHALEHHATQARRVRTTALQWHQEGQVAAAAPPKGGSEAVPFVGARSPTPFRAGKTVDRKG
ncbi:MAG: hypothetical protein HY275_02690 [Gemmatimonadetes bacterium]|nr:hypothetical protein [Gemmatimonadota bacterium]